MVKFMDNLYGQWLIVNYTDNLSNIAIEHGHRNSVFSH